MYSLWINTFTGKHILTDYMTNDDICIEDIAHGLSNICRYVGQCNPFYSVAEHSVRISRLIKSDYLRLPALLHDASEAYIGDVSSQIKAIIPEYIKLEELLMYGIFRKYDLLEYLHDPAIKLLDVQIRFPEVNSLFLTDIGWAFQGGLADYEKIKPWSAKVAEKEFLKEFHNLYRVSK